ncbi:MAG: FAD:protein FMN transferase, partial [Pseudomonadota bacterium]
VLFLNSTACDRQLQSDNITSFSGPTMGTSYNIKIADPEATSNQKELKTKVEQLLIDINQVMSTYIIDSELSILNQSKSTEWLPVSDELWLLLQEAEQISQQSEGAFDVTVGPLVNIWGFGPEKISQASLPDKQDIKELMQIIGHEKIDYHSDKQEIRKLHSEIYIDLSAIAKGYAVDQIATLLDEYDYQNYMIDIGGELIFRGKYSPKRGWRIGIEKPVIDRRAVHKVIQPDNMGMATSGDYRNFFELDDIRYSHTISPITGMPVEHKLASVTVLHKSSMYADALATTLNVLGPEDGVKFAENQGITAYFIIREDEKYKEIYTHNFDQYFVENIKQ